MASSINVREGLYIHISEQLRPRVGAYIDEGRRDNQEDRGAVIEFETADGLHAILAMVADGIGGRTSGERASRIAQEVIPQFVISRRPTTSEIPQTLVDALKEANARIYEESLDTPQRSGMGTTCTVVVIVGKRLFIAHVGDSRAYLVRNNHIYQLTIDHTWAEEVIQAKRYTLEQVKNHPNRGVIKRFLGILPDVEVDTRYRLGGKPGDPPDGDTAEKPLRLEDTDTIMLCSDGVADVLDDDTLLRILKRYPPQEASIRLVKEAYKANSQDNMTAIVIDMPEAKHKAGVPPWMPWVAGAVVLLGLGGGVAGFLFMSSKSTPTPTPTWTSIPAAVPTTSLAKPTLAPTFKPMSVHTPSGGGLIIAASTPTASPTPQTEQPTATPLPTHTPTPTPRPTPTPTYTPTHTPTPKPTPTPVPQPSGGGGGETGGGGGGNTAPTPTPQAAGTPVVP